VFKGPFLDYRSCIEKGLVLRLSPHLICNKFQTSQLDVLYEPLSFVKWHFYAQVVYYTLRTVLPDDLKGPAGGA